MAIRNKGVKQSFVPVSQFSNCLLSPSMLTVALLVAGLTATNGELLVSRTKKLSRFSGPSCIMLMVVQNGGLPRLVPMGRLTTSLVRGVKSAEAIRKK